MRGELFDFWVTINCAEDVQKAFCLVHYTGEHMAPGCTIGRRQAGGGSVMLWAMFCWETMGPAIHVDVTLTRTTYLSIVADYVHPFMETLFPGSCGVF